MIRLRIIALITLITGFFLAGCGGGGSAGTTPTPTPPGGGSGGSTTPAMSVYVTNDNDAFNPPSPSTVLQFSKTAGGSVAPLSTITGPANVIFDSIVEDAAGNLYVGGHSAGAGALPGGVDIFEYSAGSSGTATPLHIISGSGTGLELLTNNPIVSLDIDTAGNLYVAAAVVLGSGPSGRIVSGISVFPPAANGDIPPARVIAGDATTMVDPTQIALDPAGNIYVVDVSLLGPAESVLIFDSKATGNTAPAATISGSNTMISDPRGVAVDATGNIYVATLSPPASPTAPPLSGAASILVFAPGATGNVAPVRVISGSATTMGEVGHLRVDAAGNIYVLSQQTVLKFAAGASGNVAPVEAISSTAVVSLTHDLAVR